MTEDEFGQRLAHCGTSWLDFRPVESPGKTRRCDVVSHRGYVLGQIVFYPRWRQFVFEPAERTVYNPDCLRAIADAARLLTADWLQSLAERKVPASAG